MLRRTHSCGELRSEDVNSDVVLAGWVNNYRDHGGVIFIDLRDREGTTQLVFHPENAEAHALSDKLRHEDVVAAKGKVVTRQEGMANPKMVTGEIEIDCVELEILNKAETPPFTPDDADRVAEDTRLKYRFIDLRSPRMHEIFKTRYRVTKILRDVFDSHGFYEIETPFLCKSTPEGARDFLVPSRIHEGHFYALPQSPQLFKQILMTSGMEKYLQIVRCFRDEDPRADRQAEFTQIDLEMSFVEPDDVLNVVEDSLRAVWKGILDIEIGEVPRITYAEAMSRFGSDRPDMRYDMELIDICDLAARTDFKVFTGTIESGGIVKAIRVPGGGVMTRSQTDGLADWVKQFGAKGLAVTKVGASGELETGISKFITPIAGDLIERLGATEGDLLCFAADTSKVVHRTLGELRIKLAHDLDLIPEGVWKWLWVVDFPLFEWNEETGRYDSLHHPFTAPCDEDIDKLTEDHAGQVISKAYDIILNGSELGGGSIRIHSQDVQSKVFELLGIDEASAESKFGFLLNALKYGTPPHGGLALGLDRIIMHLCNTTNIRDVIAFPKTQTGADVMTEAPSPVDEAQLDELALRVQTHHLPEKAV